VVPERFASFPGGAPPTVKNVHPDIIDAIGAS
jgi:hypothetical protein